MIEVVLVDDTGKPIGTAPKASIHTADTPLHLACSALLLNSKGQVLVQKRSSHKIFAPGIWAGSCCGHPFPDEALEDAIQRIAHHELGISIKNLTLALPKFRYSWNYQGIVDNEICPTFVGQITEPIKANPAEVEHTAWIDLGLFIEQTALRKEIFAFWTEEQMSHKELQVALRKHTQS